MNYITISLNDKDFNTLLKLVDKSNSQFGFNSLLKLSVQEFSSYAFANYLSVIERTFKNEKENEGKKRQKSISTHCG